MVQENEILTVSTISSNTSLELSNIDKNIQELLEAEDPKPANPVVAVRKAKKKKKSNINRLGYDVQVIPATKGAVVPGEKPALKRVAAYCRVSTDEDAQATSFELQVQHYTEYIGAREDWVLAGIYADEGISGTQIKNRSQFQKLIEDCEAGKIDLVITKSISRFARNTVDCLTNIRKLKNLKNPVEIYFEKERLYTLDEKTDMVLGLMASIAQEESRSISANIRWAIKNRMKNGTQKICTSGLLGYDSDEDGNMIIIDQEAEVVRFIYKSFVRGIHPKLIADKMNEQGYVTVRGNSWTSNAVRKILQNEKYCGDVLMQKTITVDYLSHEKKINEGEEEQYFIQDHHDAIITRDIWDKAQEIINKDKWKNWKCREQQRLMPIQSGFLKGYISIGAKWKKVSVTRLLTATDKVAGGSEQELMVNSKNEDMDDYTKGGEDNIMETGILKGFEVVDLTGRKGSSCMTVTANNIKFNKSTAIELGYPKFVRMLIKADEKKVAIQPCTDKAKNAIEFSKDEKKQNYAVVLKITALQVAIQELLDATSDFKATKFPGHFYADENVIIFDLNEGEEIKSRGRKKAADK